MDRKAMRRDVFPAETTRPSAAAIVRGDRDVFLPNQYTEALAKHDRGGVDVKRAVVGEESRRGA
jgi:hypothetical protein